MQQLTRALGVPFSMLLALIGALCFHPPAAVAQARPADSPADPPAAPVESVLTGRLLVVWGDTPDASAPPSPRIRIRRDDDGTVLPLPLSDRLRKAPGRLYQLNGRRVRVGLTREGGTLRLQQVEPLDSVEAAAVSGTTPWLNLMCKFPDVATESRTPAYIESLFSARKPGLDHYWKNVSSGAMSIAGTVTHPQWMVLPKSSDQYVIGGYGDLNTLLNDCVSLADAHYHLPSFAGINIIFNQQLDCCAWGGLNYLSFDGETKLYGVTWLPPFGYENQAVAAHEMGHGMGLPHANNSDADGDPYDNPWDVMSAIWAYCVYDTTYGCIAKHINGYHKQRLGWMPLSDVLVPQTFPVTVDLVPLAREAGTGYRMLQLPIDGSTGRWFSVEARERKGYERSLPGNAVIIHEIFENRGEAAWVIDKNGGTFADDSGARWKPGETFTGNGYRVKVNSLADDGRYNLTVDRVPLVVNGSFENDSDGNGVPNGWQSSGTWTDADGRDCSTASKGNCSLTLTAEAGIKKAVQPLEIRADFQSRYTLTFQARAEGLGTGNAPPPVRIETEYHYPDGTFERSGIAVPGGTYGWTPQTMTLETTRHFNSATLAFVLEGGSGQLWIDQVKLVEE